MSASTAGTEPKSAAATPRLLSPTHTAPIDGSAAPFTWTSVPGARSYRLQIATDDAFTDVLYTVDAGATTLLTLYEMLPENGTVFHWRVQAQTAAGWQPWSEGASFKAATDYQAQAFAETRQPAAAAAASDRPATSLPGSAPAENEGVRPYQTEVTSRGTMLLFLSIMFVSFILTALLIIRAAP